MKNDDMITCFLYVDLKSAAPNKKPLCLRDGQASYLSVIPVWKDGSAMY